MQCAAGRWIRTLSAKSPIDACIECAIVQPPVALYVQCHCLSSPRERASTFRALPKQTKYENNSQHVGQAYLTVLLLVSPFSWTGVLRTSYFCVELVNETGRSSKYKQECSRIDMFLCQLAVISLVHPFLGAGKLRHESRNLGYGQVCYAMARPRYP